MEKQRKTVLMEPSEDHPLPYDMTDEEAATFEDKLLVAARTGEMIAELGAPIEVDEATFAQEKELLDSVIKDKNVAGLNRLPTVLGAAGFLREYGQKLAHDADLIRGALTNKLLEIADCGEARYELKAIELLGKHSDIGLFTERSEINVNYNSPESLQKAIIERVERLMKSNVIDLKPLGMDLDEELGIYVEDGDFTEVEEATPEETEVEDKPAEEA
jgi:hypothetical protein